MTFGFKISAAKVTCLCRTIKKMTPGEDNLPVESHQLFY